MLNFKTKLKNAYSWALSFFRTQIIHHHVMATGQDRGDGLVVEPIGNVYSNLPVYRAYTVDYILVGVVRPIKEDGEVCYRFYDPLMKKEFILSQSLMTLLFYKK